MPAKRSYRTFIHKGASYRICCDAFDTVTAEIIRQRQILEDYIALRPEFGRSFEPLELQENAPPIARRMARGARLVGVGPMAAVAGAMAQCAAEAGLEAGAKEVIVDNPAITDIGVLFNHLISRLSSLESKLEASQFFVKVNESDIAHFKIFRQLRSFPGNDEVVWHVLAELQKHTESVFIAFLH